LTGSIIHQEILGWMTPSSVYHNEINFNKDRKHIQSGHKLRYSKPDQPRPFKIPGGLAGIWIVGGLGGIGVVFAFIVGLILPPIFPNAPIYVDSVLLGTFLLAVPPLVFMRFKKPSWTTNAQSAEMKPE
jgi:hypothetical protein